ncbi:Enoyl-CoA delta isomerase 3 [Grifola frondosa]|uniref:Enoyl-CoA delta isomerase 3 n=1 Tax=Grifola frondosa TaxID=5627 RepID=A0A1C7M7C8_GRIFR|nr:Enoyl-CoA delta isomerase 3 [Grifola frondosa]
MTRSCISQLQRFVSGNSNQHQVLYPHVLPLTSSVQPPAADSDTPDTISAIKPALDVVEKHWREGWRAARVSKDEAGGKGAVIIVGKRGQDKFFSNGLDFANATKDPSFTPNFFPLTFNPLLRRLLAFPIPTVAAINGHCFAGGMMLSLACDYRIMTDGSKRNAWMCMNEIHFGAAWPLSFAAILRAKVPDPRVQRQIALEGHRFTPKDALAVGLLDRIVSGDTEAVLDEAQAFAESISGLSTSGAWGLIKRDLYRDVIEASSRDVLPRNVVADDAAAKARL